MWWKKSCLFIKTVSAHTCKTVHFAVHPIHYSVQHSRDVVPAAFREMLVVREVALGSTWIHDVISGVSTRSADRTTVVLRKKPYTEVFWKITRWHLNKDTGFQKSTTNIRLLQRLLIICQTMWKIKKEICLPTCNLNKKTPGPGWTLVKCNPLLT